MKGILNQSKIDIQLLLVFPFVRKESKRGPISMPITQISQSTLYKQQANTRYKINTHISIINSKFFDFPIEISMINIDISSEDINLL